MKAYNFIMTIVSPPTDIQQPNHKWYYRTFSQCIEKYQNWQL